MRNSWPWIVVALLVLVNLLLWAQVLRVAGKKVSLRINDQQIALPEIFQTPEPAAQKIVSSQVVPILMYHYIRDYHNPFDELGVRLSVSPAVFQRQLQTLKTAGYTPITLEDFVAQNYGSKPIILTFDDGYDDHYTSALPILKAQGFKGTFFIVKDFVGRPGYMTRQQVDQLRSDGMEIGAHTLDHKDLATLSYDEAYRQIAGSFFDTANVFAYPSGKYNSTTLGILRGLNVAAAVTTNLGVATDLSPPLELPRIRVLENTDILKIIAEQTALLKKVPKSSQANPDQVKSSSGAASSQP